MAALVSSRISQTGRFLLLPRSLKITGARPRLPGMPPPDRTGSGIVGFSENSRRRLRFTALNAWPQLISQFGLTYHQNVPTDGKLTKKHLNRFLTVLRKNHGISAYLWILEFQRRGAPHYHLFLPVAPSDSLRCALASAWISASDQSGDLQALAFHSHPKNFISWDMGNGSYLCKYLEKECQKLVPDNFSNVGRFWGCSRGLVPVPVGVGFDDFASAHDLLDEETGECSDAVILAARWLGKWYQRQGSKKSRKYRRNFRVMALYTGWTLANGAGAFKQIESYLAKRSEIAKGVEDDNCAKMASYAMRKATRYATLFEVPPLYPDGITEAFA